jgi:serine phosphatase RsbU (regulator of sigma subunit)/anti-anti-sigma regulatory factor
MQQIPNILIVDDEEPIRAMLHCALEMSDEYVVHEAADGIEALDYLDRENIDLVITDLAMPRLGGLELMQKAREVYPRVSWLILSGRGTFDDAVRAVHLGAFDFVTKPLVAIDSFLVTVRNVLRQRHLEEERIGLLGQIEQRNRRLAEQVVKLQQACTLLRKQAGMIQEDLRRAELIQRALLPREVPRVDGVSIDTIYRPSQNVGGDLYDVVRLDERHLVAYVADAAGHGVSAAMLAVLFKHRIPLTCDWPPRPTEPRRVLASVNDCITEECKAPGLFVTAAYCLIDTHTCEAQFSSAGHPAPVLIRSDGAAIHLSHTGPALGLRKDGSFEQTRFTLQPGDRLLMYTDGLLDAAGRNALSLQGIDEILARSDRRGQELLQDLLAASLAEETTARDDVTLLLLATDGAPSELDHGSPSRAEQMPPVGRPTDSTILRGRVEDRGVLAVRGRGDWLISAAFHEEALNELGVDEELLLDFTGCEYLDSTFLGTVQEIVEKADALEKRVTLQNVARPVRELFEELGMRHVLDRVVETPDALPEPMVPVDASPAGTGESENGFRMLQAHQALASLNEDNQKDFSKLIGQLREEIGI